MSARAALRFALLTAGLAVGTVVVGWWALPVVGSVWGLSNRGARWVGVTAAGAGALAWGILLGWTSTARAFGALMSRTSGVMGLPPVVLVGLTLLFAALASGAAAGLVASLAPTAVRASEG